MLLCALCPILKHSLHSQFVSINGKHNNYYTVSFYICKAYTEFREETFIECKSGYESDSSYQWAVSVNNLKRQRIIDNTQIKLLMYHITEKSYTFNWHLWYSIVITPYFVLHSCNNSIQFSTLTCWLKSYKSQLQSQHNSVQLIYLRAWHQPDMANYS
jgi:hypothetical protein